MHINEIEVFWITLNGTTLVLTIFALIAALVTRRRISGLPNRAARIVARGGIRRELFRVFIQILLLAIAVPALYRDGATPLTPFLAAFIAVPVLLFLNTLGDAYDRFRLAQIVADEIVADRDEAYDRLVTMIERNTEVSQMAADKSGSAAESAERAYREANRTNAKIAAQGERIDAQAERLDEQAERIDAGDTLSAAQGDTLTAQSDRIDVHGTRMDVQGARLDDNGKKDG